MDAWGGDPCRGIKYSRGNDTTAAGAVGGLEAGVARGLVEGCMGRGHSSLRRLEGM